MNLGFSLVYPSYFQRNRSSYAPSSRTKEIYCVALYICAILLNENRSSPSCY